MQQAGQLGRHRVLLRLDQQVMEIAGRLTALQDINIIKRSLYIRIMHPIDIRKMWSLFTGCVYLLVSFLGEKNSKNIILEIKPL